MHWLMGWQYPSAKVDGFHLLVKLVTPGGLILSYLASNLPWVGKLATRYHYIQFESELDLH